MQTPQQNVPPAQDAGFTLSALAWGSLVELCPGFAVNLKRLF